MSKELSSHLRRIESKVDAILTLLTAVHSVRKQPLTGRRRGNQFYRLSKSQKTELQDKWSETPWELRTKAFRVSLAAEYKISESMVQKIVYTV